jgi:hypothetical protein
MALCISLLNVNQWPLDWFKKQTMTIRSNKQPKIICDICYVKKEGNMVRHQFAFYNKDNGFSKLQSLLKHYYFACKITRINPKSNTRIIQ